VINALAAARDRAGQQVVVEVGDLKSREHGGALPKGSWSH
jgi:hypothetical protein